MKRVTPTSVSNPFSLQSLAKMHNEVDESAAVVSENKPKVSGGEDEPLLRMMRKYTKKEKMDTKKQKLDG